MSRAFAYLSGEDGFSMAEYALAAAVVGVAIALSAGFLSGMLGSSAGVFRSVADCVRYHSNISTC